MKAILRCLIICCVFIAGLLICNPFALINNHSAKLTFHADAGEIPEYSITEAYQLAQPLNKTSNGRKFITHALITSTSARLKKYFFDDNYGPKIREIMRHDKILNFDSFEIMINNEQSLNELRVYYDGFLVIEAPRHCIIFPIEKITIDKIKAL